MVTKNKKIKATVKKQVSAPVRKAKTEKKAVEEEIVEEEELYEEEEIVEEEIVEEEEEIVEEEVVVVGTELLLHYKKNKGGNFWLTKTKKVNAEETFWWAKDSMPKAFADLFTVVEETKIKSHRDFLGKGAFHVQEVKGGWIIVNTELNTQVSDKLTGKEAKRICTELNT